jgi:DUF1680 family protein
VNLFIPSELNWTERGLQLRQETKYPESEHISLNISAAPLEKIALRVRIPGWLQTAPTVKINGKTLDSSAAPGSYLTLNRVWKQGDRVEMEFPM